MLAVSEVMVISIKTDCTKFRYLLIVLHCKHDFVYLVIRKQTRILFLNLRLDINFNLMYCKLFPGESNMHALFSCFFLDCSLSLLWLNLHLDFTVYFPFYFWCCIHKSIAVA